VDRRFFDWIWHIRGTVQIPQGQSNDNVFERLDPLFQQRGTRHETSRDKLIFQKKDQDAQDKMSVFDSGVLQIERGAEGPVLRYHMISRALLYCFFAPLLFLAFAQITIFLGNLEKGKAETEETAKDEKKEEEKVRTLHPIDQFLGAPEPEKPKTDEEKKAEKEKDKDKGPSPTPAYVFAGIFAVLYIVGRLLEAWLIKTLLRKHLTGNPSPDGEQALAK
jgi:hypothetical protein